MDASVGGLFDGVEMLTEEVEQSGLSEITGDGMLDVRNEGFDGGEAFAPFGLEFGDFSASAAAGDEEVAGEDSDAEHAKRLAEDQGS